MTHPALALTEQLVARRSVTPEDAGCQDLIAARLAAIGFECRRIDSGPADFRVANLWAVRRGTAGRNGRLLAFAGHTDVVPTGPVERWSSEPFVPTHRDGRLYGRGTADMKSFIAVALALVPEFRAKRLKRPIHLCLSYDEEVGCFGAPKLLALLGRVLPKPALAIVGEPTEMKVVHAHKLRDAGDKVVARDRRAVPGVDDGTAMPTAN